MVTRPSSRRGVMLGSPRLSLSSSPFSEESFHETQSSSSSTTTESSPRVGCDNLLNGSSLLAPVVATGAAMALLGSPEVAQAATAAAPDAIPSALAAYGHYLSILIVLGAILTERLTVTPGMDIEDEKRLVFVDILLGVSGIGLVVSGYYRATAYGKGWDFYSHEPIFWTKQKSR